MWWLPGIFRDVTLLERPPAAIDDVFVHADYDHVTGSGTLRVECATGAARASVPELGIRDLATGEPRDHPASSRGRPRCPGCTTATLVAVPGETVELADRLPDGRDRRRACCTVNGRPMFFRGVNRHEHDPDAAAARSTVDTMRQRPGADEAAQHQRGPDRALSAASRVPRPVRRARAVGRSTSATSRPTGSSTPTGAGNPADDPDWAPMHARPDAADGRARQEPPERDHLVAGQRELPRPRTSARWRRGPASAIPAGRVLRAGPQLRSSPTSTA